MNRKYQIFISSTYDDLKDERDAVAKAILEMGHIPVGMEMFSAADADSWKLITQQIDATDYYVLIIAHRYGSMTSGVSFTEKEYEYAISNGVPVLSFLIDQKAAWPSDRIESERAVEMTSFREKVKNRNVSFWSSKDDLKTAVAIALPKQFALSPRPGWIRGDQATTPETTAELARLSAENAELRSRVVSSADIRFVPVSGELIREANSATNLVIVIAIAPTAGASAVIPERTLALRLTTESGIADAAEVNFHLPNSGAVTRSNGCVTITGPGSATLLARLYSLPTWGSVVKAQLEFDIHGAIERRERVSFRYKPQAEDLNLWLLSKD